MRILLWILVGLTCLMLASCPAKKDDPAAGQPAGGEQPNTDDPFAGE